MMIHHGPTPLVDQNRLKETEDKEEEVGTHLLAFDFPLDFFAEFKLKEEEGLFLVSKPPE